MQPHITSEFRESIGQAAVDAAKVSPLTTKFLLGDFVHGHDLIFSTRPCLCHFVATMFYLCTFQSSKCTLQIHSGTNRVLPDGSNV